MSDKPEIVIAASPECIERLALPGRGIKPDFTVTAARLESTSDSGFMIAWETQSAGFGTVTIYRDDAGVLKCDNEAMSLRFVKEVFAKFLEGLGIGE